VWVAHPPLHLAAQLLEHRALQLLGALERVHHAVVGRAHDRLGALVARLVLAVDVREQQQRLHVREQLRQLGRRRARRVERVQQHLERGRGVMCVMSGSRPMSRPRWRKTAAREARRGARARQHLRGRVVAAQVGEEPREVVPQPRVVGRVAQRGHVVLDRFVVVVRRDERLADLRRERRVGRVERVRLLERVDRRLGRLGGGNAEAYVSNAKHEAVCVETRVC
jgi:hypothetical protein